MPWVPMGYPGGALPPNIASIMLIYIYICHFEATLSANGHSYEVASPTLKPATRDRFPVAALDIVESLAKLAKILFINEDKVDFEC